MNKINLVIILIISITQASRSQLVPQIPCPDIFSYVINSQTGQIEGRITVADTQSGRENLIWIRMSYPPYIVNDHPGVIGTTSNNRDIVEDLQNGHPVIYKINFPIASPVPTVQEIISNGRTICKNKVFQSGYNDIVLHYKLSVPNNITSNKYFLTDSNQIIQAPQHSIANRTTTVQKNPIFINSATQNSIACGTSGTPVRFIAGGDRIQPGSWPWLAAVFRKSSANGKFEYLCGGSIIAPNAILTAAHCVIQENRIHRPEEILIGLGLFNVYEWNEENTFIARTYNIIPHGDYGHTSRLYDADIAIIVLDKSYSYNDRVRPICMFSGANDVNVNLVNQQGNVAGWGVAKVGGGIEQLPNIIETEIVSTDRCRNSNSVIRDLISNRNFCAGYLNGHGPCKGDSGSGLMIDINGIWYLRGIVSGALGHVKTVCNLNEYVIYTDVAKFIRWTRSYVNF